MELFDIPKTKQEPELNMKPLKAVLRLKKPEWRLIPKKLHRNLQEWRWTADKVHVEKQVSEVEIF